MRKSVLGLILCLFLPVYGCTGSGAKDTRAVLDDVETFLSARPDSALRILRGIDMGSLRYRKDRARASLLHSIALDKCYIDVTSDSILAPALVYYKHHGSADQKLKSRYYRAVLARNAGDRDTQMDWLVNAEKYIPRAKDREMAGFIYTAKRVLFLDLLDLEHAEENARLAVSVYAQNDLPLRYYNSVISLAGILQMQERYDEAKAWIDTLESHADYLTSKQLNSTFVLQIDQKDSSEREWLPGVIDSYLIAFPDETTVLWLNVAEGWRRVGDLEKAEQSLERYCNSLQYDDNDPEYWLVSHRIYQSLGKFERSNACYLRYSDIIATRRQRAISSEARFIQERTANKERHIRDWILSLGFAALGSAIIVSLLVSLLRRKKASILLDNTVKEQSEQIKILRDAIENKKDERNTSVYREYIQNCIRQIDRTKWRDAITKDNSILSTLREGFELSYPKSMGKLRGRGLKNRELTCCCLLSLGFNRKELAGLLGYKNPLSIYNLTTHVRKKLRLPEGEESIESYLNDLFSSE